jgi:hypothetical protein
VTERLIELLYKGSNHNSLNNWCPITLLNVSYKLIAKAIQIRLQPILTEIISYDQFSFLPMHFILDNIFLYMKPLATPNYPLNPSSSSN